MHGSWRKILTIDTQISEMERQFPQFSQCEGWDIWRMRRSSPASFLREAPFTSTAMRGANGAHFLLQATALEK